MIKFGTSGWRAIIAEEFTFANVALVTQAICNVLHRVKTGGEVIVGNDTRFMAEKFARVCALQLADNGYQALLCRRDMATPAIAYAIRSRGMRGGINFTASHNPPEYCGMKFSTDDGAPALPEVTRAIETEIGRLLELGGPSEDVTATARQGGKVEDFDPTEEYLKDLASKVDLNVIAKSGLKIIYDPLWGTGRGLLDRILREAGCDVKVLHDWRDPYFGGHSPEPSEENLAELRALVSKEGALGLSTDGDSDRFGILDRDGSYIVPNLVIALLVDYLSETRKWDGGVARSVASSHLIDRVARSHGLSVHETPVGFKFIGELINQNKLIIGGEESAGLSIHGHYPEKDGIIACLLVAEMVARRGASIQSMLENIYQRVGRVYNRRIGVHLTPEIKANIQARLNAETPDHINGRKVASVNRVDGVKYIFEDGSWLLVRLSGTEPLARCYAEADTEQDLEVLLESGRKFILGQ
ncbi:MAG: phosphoglucomutase/phosphomannomutase family protein [Acidobacteriota bacterium]